MFGATANDNSTDSSKKAELFLLGDEDDDTFTVRAFVKVDPNDPKAPFVNINGGQGADFVAFTVNAPVRIDGGDGRSEERRVGKECRYRRQQGEYVEKQTQSEWAGEGGSL